MQPSRLQDTIELVHAAKSGHGPSLEELLQRYGPRLMARVRILMGPRARELAEASDFLQSVFVEVIGNLARFEVRDENGFLRWVTQIARNKIRSGVRKKRERAFAQFATAILPAANSSTPSTEISRMEQAQQLVEALEQLPHEQQLVIELRHFERMSFNEIGERLGKTQNAVQLSHTRALMRLGRMLGASRRRP